MVSVDPYSTHLPMLYRALQATEGSVVEFGSGPFSTPLLHNTVCSVSRRLITIEEDGRFVAKLANMADEFHEIYHAPTKGVMDKLISELSKDRYGVVFVDHQLPSSEIKEGKPGCYEPRAEVALWALDYADLVVVHDVERPECFGQTWEQFLEKAVCQHVDVTLQPHTGVYAKTNWPQDWRPC